MVEFHIGTKLEDIARALYSPDAIGVVSLLHAIPVGFRTKLLEQLRAAPYEQAPPLYKHTCQDFSRFSSETHPLETLPESLSFIAELASVHKRLYHELGEIAGFERTAKTTYNAHRYPSTRQGLGIHRDESIYRNLVAIYVLSGDREFIAARERDVSCAEFIQNPPGSIIFLRAPRTDSEKTLRPYHGVLAVNSPSHIISFRHEVA